MTHVLLVGFMGSGKTSVGRILASELGVPFVDLDSVIESSAGMSVAEIFDRDGEARFRGLEAAALRELDGAQSSVVACGGGVVLREANRRLLAELGTVVFLRVAAATVAARIGDASSRPLLRGRSASEIESLLAERGALYEAVADITIDTEGSTPAEVAKSIRNALAERG